MKYTILLAMSLLSALFGCNNKKTTAQTEASPRFPATDNPAIKVANHRLDDGFDINSFYIAPDRQQVYVLGRRNPASNTRKEEGAEPLPGIKTPIDFRLYCLDSKGNIQFHKDWLKTDWQYGGNLGALNQELMLRIGDCFLVLNPANFEVIETIPVHASAYIAMEELTRTRDEQQADYQKEFEAICSNPDAKWLEWSPAGEQLLWIAGKKGKRAAWEPLSYDEEVLTDLKTPCTNGSADQPSGYRHPGRAAF
ncbi:MAG: hypothetical protein IPL65_17555 [Lewinellaceae bacterium]|nr:hypothetical protein [Lewinellaceae bacterium]